MSLTRYWILAYFPDTEEYEVAPSAWLTEDGFQCYWPPWKNGDRVSGAVAKNEAPDASWDTFRFRVIGNKIFETYDAARGNLAKAGYTSDFSDKEVATRLRPKKRNKTDSKETFQWVSEKKSKIQDGLPEFPKEPETIEESFELSLVSETVTAEASHANPEATVLETPEPRTIFSVPDTIRLDVIADTFHENSHASDSPNDGQELFESNKEFTTYVTKKMETQELLLRQLHSKTDKLINILVSTATKGDFGVSHDRTGLPAFPIDTIETLDNLNEKISVDVALRQKLVTFFQLIGGMDAENAIRRMIDHFLSVEIRNKLTWCGTVEKKGFKFYEFPRIILEALAKNSLTSIGATDALVQAVCMTKFKNAANAIKIKGKRSSTKD